MRPLFVGIAIALGGCYGYGAPSAAPYPEAPYDGYVPAYTGPARSKVQVLTAVAISQPTQILGLVEVFRIPYDHEAAIEALKVKAEALGADAIVGLEFHHGEYGAKSRLAGTAIKFKDLVRGRSYEPIGAIEVTYDVGEEQKALRALKAKARAIDANLIFDLEYHLFEVPRRISGTAVRFVDAPKAAADPAH